MINLHQDRNSELDSIKELLIDDLGLLLGRDFSLTEDEVLLNTTAFLKILDSMSDINSRDFILSVTSVH